MRILGTFRHIFERDSGSALVELAIVVPILMIPILASVDFGRAYYLGQEVASAANVGAEYGAQNPTDTTGMKAAAQAAAPDVTGLSIPTPTYGCECADGTSFSANCSSTPSCSGNNAVYRVSVTASVSYVPLIRWPGIPSPISISATAKMRSAKG